jgi:hypothetical protein
VPVKIRLEEREVHGEEEIEEGADGEKEEDIY